MAGLPNEVDAIQLIDEITLYKPLEKKHAYPGDYLYDDHGIQDIITMSIFDECYKRVI